CYNCKEHRHVARECQKPKRAKDAAYHKEKMLLCKQEEAEIQLNAEQANWKDDTNDESDDQELEAHYMYMAKLQQNDEDADVAKERELLASLIKKLKCEIDESKNRNTLLEASNKVLVEKLKSEIENFKNKNKSLKEENSKLSKEHDLLFADFKKSKAELKRRDNIEYTTEIELACAKVRGDFLSYKMESQRLCNTYTQTINDLNQTISEMENKLSAHQDTISILKQQKDAQIKLYKSREDKELEKVIDLENKVKVLDNIVYKTGQTVQTMNLLNNKCRTSFVKPEYLKKAKQANPRLYDIGCYNDNLALMLSPESDEVIRLEKESQSKLSNLIKPFDYAKLNNLYDLFVPQREKSSEQRFFRKIKRVILTTSVSRPPLKSNPQGDKVVHNNSQGKKQEVEDQCRSVKLYKNKTSVTACNDILNAKTLNVKSIFAKCDKCVLHDKHDMCVLKSVAKPIKKTVTLESNKKPKNFTRKLYERVSKTCSWWYPMFTPSGYIWKPKSRKENVNPNVSMPLGNASRTANVMHTMTSRDGENLDKMKEKGDE
nr:hypothetical protein [Tanacetum cinerariifolium]